MTETEISGTGTGTAARPAAGAGPMGSCLAEHRPFLLRLACSQLEHGAAEDAVQETLMAAWTNASAFRQASSLRTWLVSILRHKIVDQIRRRRRASQGHFGKTDATSADCSVGCAPPEPDAPYFGGDDPFAAQFDSEGAWLREHVDWHPDASSQVEQAQLLRLLQACLEVLPPKTSRIFLMREYLGFEAAEIAEETRLTPGNVRVVLYRARMSLKTCLALKLPGEL